MKNQKQDVGKLRYDLLPFNALDKIVEVLTIGAVKYEPNNWLADSGPEDIPRYEAALLRHMSEHMQEHEIDDESGCEHMAHIACNALFIMGLKMKFEEVLEAELLPSKLSMSETPVKVRKKVPVCLPDDELPF